MILLSKRIFTGCSAEPIEGFVAIAGNKIEAVGTIEESKQWVEKDKEVYDLGDKLITPGFVDCHTFFTGYVLESLGVDFSQVKTEEEGIQCLHEYEKKREAGKPLFGHGLNLEQLQKENKDFLNKEFPKRPVVIFTAGRDTCLMNQAAKEKYQFTEDACYAEKIWRMMKDYLSEPDMKERYIAYQKMLNSKGITTIKEMSFDDYYGFFDVMKELEQEGSLTARVSLMSQPVGQGINIEHGIKMRETCKGDFLKFGGYNRMTDRGIAGGLAELIEPYACYPDSTCLVPVEWELIEHELMEADKNDFRFSLHCQGDGAVRHTVDLYEKCQMINGKLKNRHAITDLEYTNPSDLERFGKIGGIAEVYAQIQSLDKKEDVVSIMESQLGGDRGKNYWNRRKMWDSGVCVSCGTDLPLLIPDIPEAIWCGCGGHMADRETLNKENMLTIKEMLLAWTRNGQYNCYNEDRLGTLEPGKLADITVMDRDIFTTPMEEMKQVKAAMTISDGRIVYNNL